MYLSEIQDKDVIELQSGVNLGKIIDAKIDDKGQIVTFTAEPKHFFKKIFKSSEATIYYTNIVKIGTDVILVNLVNNSNNTSE